MDIYPGLGRTPSIQNSRSGGSRYSLRKLTYRVSISLFLKIARSVRARLVFDDAIVRATLGDAWQQGGPS